MSDSNHSSNTPASHHWLGTGPLSNELVRAVADPEALLDRVAAMVEAAGLGVVARQRVDFEGGGHTFVWVLAESHLVLHHWQDEGFATLDLHVCDYRESNASKAARLKENLDALTFAPGQGSWHELSLPRPL